MLVAKHGFNIVAVEADWPDPGQKERVRADLAEPLLERAIGVIYRPGLTETSAVAAQETTAYAGGPDENYPFGL